MPFQKVEFEFPDEKEESTEIEIESSSAETLGAEKEEVSNEVELEVVDDDIPAKDKDETGQLRKPGKPPEDLTDDELDEYSDKVQKRIKSLSSWYPRERLFESVRSMKDWPSSLLKRTNVSKVRSIKTKKLS